MNFQRPLCLRVLVSKEWTEQASETKHERDENTNDAEINRMKSYSRTIIEEISRGIITGEMLIQGTKTPH